MSLFSNRAGSIAANDGDESLIVDLDLIGLQPVGSDLPADKLAASDLELLAFRIARQADDLPFGRATGPESYRAYWRWQ